MTVELLKTDDTIKYKKELKILLENLKIENAEELITDLKGYIKENQCFCIGAFENNELIGILWSYMRYFAGEERFHINYFSISLNYRGKGIGSLLLKKLQEIAVDKNVKIIDLNVDIENIRAQNFYKKNKFKEEKIFLSLEVGEV